MIKAFIQSEEGDEKCSAKNSDPFITLIIQYNAMINPIKA